MLLTIVSVYDSGVYAWLPPIYVRNEGEAKRMFEEEVNNPQSKLSKYPFDYVLFKVGTFNDENCKFTLLDAPERIAIGSELKTVSSGQEDDRVAKKDTK